MQFFVHARGEVRVSEDDMFSLLQYVNQDLNDIFEADVWPLSALGVGRADLVRKTLNTIWGLRLQCEGEDHFSIRRSEYRGALTDQGVERGLGDSYVLDAASSGMAAGGQHF